MPIPALNIHGDLIEGEYIATLDEIEERYGRTSKCRQRLMQGLRAAAVNLAAAGVKKIWVDGSFITAKREPNDIDGCWEYNNAVDLEILDEVFLSEHARVLVRDKYGLDFFIAQIVEGWSGKPFPQFFQMSREGRPKGIVVVTL